MRRLDALPDLAGLENMARGKPAQQSSPSRWSQPGGAGRGVNGCRSGGSGLHTGAEAMPWWRVDLRERHAMSFVILWNREDAQPDQARHIEIEVSDDAVTWRGAYFTADTPFGGVASGTPLVLAAEGLQARYLRLRRRTPGCLALEEVEVWVPLTPARRRLRDFCARIGEDADSVLAWQHHGAVPQLRFAEAPGDPPAVTSITLRRFPGRFGNQVQQMVHAIHFARRHGIGRIFLNECNPPGLTGPVEIGGLVLSPAAARPADGASLHAQFFQPLHFAATLRALDPAGLAEIADLFIRPLFGARFPVAAGDNAATLHIHLRSGDVFGAPRVNPLYGQPPLAFYRLVVEDAIRRLGIGRVVLVHEDEANPCIAALRDWLGARGIPQASQSGSFEADVGALLAAEHLVIAKGTFALPICLLAPRLRHVYGFRDLSGTEVLAARGGRRWRVADAAGGYIPEGGWRNTPAQRAMMLDYPPEALRLLD